MCKREVCLDVPNTLPLEGHMSCTNLNSLYSGMLKLGLISAGCVY